MSEVTAELNIESETELFEQFARFGVSKATYEFYTDVKDFDDRPDVEVHHQETELHGENISDDVFDVLGEAFNEFAEKRASNVGRTVDDDIACLTYDTAARQIVLEGTFERWVRVEETYQPDEE